MSFFVHKWKLYLYLNGVCIKKLKINANESPKDNTYIFNVFFKKQIYGSNIVKIIVRPSKVIYTDKRKKKHIGNLFTRKELIFNARNYQT